MTRPRKPFGHRQPGRLPSTMMKVLAAEMSDPQRLRRGKQYAHDGMVVDIVIEPGAVTCEVEGSRSVPYIATIHVTLGDGMPLRRDVEGHCTCPDFDNVWGTAAGGSDICKHVVAAMFTLADELLLEPELLDLWRGRPIDAPLESVREPDPEIQGADSTPEPTVDERRRPSEHPALQRRHLRLVGGEDHDADDGGNDEIDETGEETGDPLAALLVVPQGTVLPRVDAIERMEPVLPPRRELAAVMRDALANLRIEWE